MPEDDAQPASAKNGCGERAGTDGSSGLQAVAAAVVAGSHPTINMAMLGLARSVSRCIISQRSERGSDPLVMGCERVCFRCDVGRKKDVIFEF